MVYYAAKAATVPQAALTTAKIINPTSCTAKRRSKAIFAATGPMTQRTNAEKAPTKAIMEPNSGMKMDTATVRQAKTDRSMTMRWFFTRRVFFDSALARLARIDVVWSCEGWGDSRPKMISSVMFT